MPTRQPKILAVLLSVLVSGTFVSPVLADEPFFEETDVFVTGGRANYRIPSLVVSKDGTILAFANRRVDTVVDGAPETDLVLRRSLDNGKTWLPIQDLFAREGWGGSIGNAIKDDTTGMIMVTYYRNPGTDTAKTQAKKNKEEAGAFIARSADSGETWIHKKLIRKPNDMSKGACAHGSGPGITLQFGPKKGRLLMPAYFVTKGGKGGGDVAARQEYRKKHFYNCAIYSDDHGRTWKTSGPVQAGTDESCLAETSSGEIYLNSRTNLLDYKRRAAWSHDGGETFTDFGMEPALIEHAWGCNASIVRYPESLPNGKSLFIFSNPANIPNKRIRMTVRLSFDEGKTWPVSKLINEGHSAYSALAVSPDGTIYCFYEAGKDKLISVSQMKYDKMVLARFNLAWVTDGIEKF